MAIPLHQLAAAIYLIAGLTAGLGQFESRLSEPRRRRLNGGEHIL